MKSLLASSGLTDFWSCPSKIPTISWSVMVEQFLCICRQKIGWIGLKFGGPNHYVPLPAWWTFGHAQLNSHRSLSSDLLSSFYSLQTNHWRDWAQIWWTNSLWASPSLVNFWLCSADHTVFWSFLIFFFFLAVSVHLQTDQIELKFGESTHFMPPQAWSAFGHALLNPSSDRGTCIHWCRVSYYLKFHLFIHHLLIHLFIVIFVFRVLTIIFIRYFIYSAFINSCINSIPIYLFIYLEC